MALDGESMARPPEGPWITENDPSVEAEGDAQPSEEQQAPGNAGPESRAQESVEGPEEAAERSEGADNDPREENGFDAQTRMANAAENQVIATIVQAALLFLTLIATAIAAWAAARAAKAAQTSADISERSMIQLERPHLFVDSAKFDVPLLRESFDYEGEVRHPFVIYKVTNYGRSPAVVTEICGQVYVGDSLPSTPPYRSDDIYALDDEHVIASEGDHTYRAMTRDSIDGGVMNDLGVAGSPFTTKPVQILFFGYLTYESLVGQSETFGFCWRYNLGLGRFLREHRDNYVYRHPGKAPNSAAEQSRQHSRHIPV